MNILTIDFDIIMKPSIYVYNDLIATDTPMKEWVDNYSFIANIPADLYIYEYLTRIIMEVAPQADTYFISNHKSVVDILNKYKNKNLDLVNIDHHHDIGYEIKDWNKHITFPNCGDWVKHLMDKGKVKSYTWVNNDNSSYPEKAGAAKYLTRDMELGEFSLTDFPKFDVLIICASFEWIPPMYEPLFLTWQTICEELKKEEFLIDKF